MQNKIKDALNTTRGVDMSKVNIVTESIFANIDLILTDIDLAVEPDRIRHSMSSMLYIET